MNPKDRMHAAAVDRYWDALALTGQPPETPSPDLETAALIDRLWALSAPPEPDVARDRVWQRLQEQREEGQMDAGTFGLVIGLPSSAPPDLNGRIASRSLPSRGPAWWRGMPGHVATAALLMLVIVVGLFAAGPLRPVGESTEPAGLPAVITAPATPAPGEATQETLLEITIPTALLPQGDRIAAEFDHVTSPAGSTGIWTASSGAGYPGLRVHYVVDGYITVRADGAAQVVRAGAGTMPEEVAAGTAVVLETGDAWIARNETPFEAVNSSEEPTDLLLWVLANIEDPAQLNMYPPPGNWHINNYIPDPPGVEAPTGPATLRLRLVELPVEGRLPAPPRGLQYGLPLLKNAAGTPVVGPSVGNLPDGRLVNIGRKAAMVYVLSLEPSVANAEASPAGTAAP